MIKIKIDKTKTFMPLTKAKGTTEERFQKAIDLNIKFYKNLQDSFEKREIKPSAFKRVLNETTGKRIGIKMTESLQANKAVMGHYLSSRCAVKGYTFAMPYTFLTGNIRQSLAPTFLLETQRFFNEIFNPKIYTRIAAVVNKTKDSGASVKIFYDENVAEKQKLTQEKLDTFLEKRPASEQIDLLQFLRYSLLSDLNIKKAQPAIDRQREKAENMKILNKNYDLSDYKFNEKLEMLNKKLAETIKAERERLAQSRQ